MQVWKRVRGYVEPSAANAYRPHLLTKSWLLFFLSLSLAVEGFLVSSLVASPTNDVFLADVSIGSTSAAVGSAQMGDTIMRSMERQMVRTFSNEDVTNATLGSVIGLLLILVAFSFFLHMDIQTKEGIVGALAIAALAFVCIQANIRLLGDTPQPAQVIGSIPRG